MRRRAWYLGLVLAAGATAGCGTVRVTDPLPPGAAKGYAEFYMSYRTKNGGQVFQLNHIADGESRDVGDINPTHVLDRRRVACAPGRAKFGIRCGDDFSLPAALGMDAQDLVQVTVPIREGMVTPVRVVYASIGAQASGPGRSGGVTTVYRVKPRPGPPVPLAWHEACLKDKTCRETYNHWQLPNVLSLREALAD